MTALAFPAFAEDALPQVPCEAYIVMDADSGQVLMEHNADEVLFPASITKIMTMGLAIEKAAGDWNQPVTISYDAVHQLEAGSDHVALMEGEVIRVEDLLYATAMPSANDAANALAQFFGADGTIQSGVDAMNQKAAELGLEHTHYMNPHGLHDDNHYTTARDMAKITRWALGLEGFKTVFGRNEPWYIQPTNKQPLERPCRHTDLMRINTKYYEPYIKGSKTGFTNQAQRTFVNYAEQGDLRVISVELGCPTNEARYAAAKMLLDYTFEHFHRVTIPAPQENFAVDLVGGGSSLGKVTVKAPEITAILHDSFSPNDVTADYSIPDQYVLGRPFSASVHYQLKENGIQPTDLGGGELQVEGLPQVIKVNTYVPQSSLEPQRNPLGFALGMGAALTALLMSVRLLRKSKEYQPEARDSAKNSKQEWDIIAQKPLPGSTTIYLNQKKTNQRADTRRRK